jgi:methionyl aminopeptidase
MIDLKTPAEIDKMRKPAHIVGTILAELRTLIRPGVTTGELDRVAEKRINEFGARSAFKNYKVGPNVFPAVLCASVNEEVVHGIPNDRPVEEGDILSLDFGVEIDGFFGDSAFTAAVGEIDEESRRLLEVTERSLFAGIAEMKPGGRIGDIGAAVQEVAENEGFSVVRDFVGHGIGRALHEDPQVPNFGSRGKGRGLRAGMVLAVEPMVNVGTPEVRVLDDGWTAVTADGRRSAHFEHTIAITENGAEILTKV